MSSRMLKLICAACILGFYSSIVAAQSLNYDVTMGSLISTHPTAYGASSVISLDGRAMEADTAHYAFTDTNYTKYITKYINFKWWPSSFGADFYMTGEFYGFHPGELRSVTSGAGYGVEIRVHPLLAGVMVGFCGSEGIPDFPYGTYSFSSLYAGVTLHDYRVEIGQIYGDNSMWGSSGGPPPADYTVDYLGVSKRWADVVFFEPGIKIMFPVVTHSELEPLPTEFIPVTSHYQMRDFYLSLNVKFGFGFN